MNTFFSVLFTLEVIWIIIILWLNSKGPDNKVALALFFVAQWAILVLSVIITLIVLLFNFLEKA